MPLPIPAEELAVGDYSTYLGTVKSITNRLDSKGNITGYDIYWWNGQSQMGVAPFDIYEGIVQGGDMAPDPNETTVRPGLAEDHRDGR